MNYQFYRPTAGNVDLLIKEVYPEGAQSPEAMGADVVDMTFTLPTYVGFKINDYCMVYGRRYNINLTPTVNKKADREYNYTIQLEAYWYDLAKVNFNFPNPQNALSEFTFTLMGNAATFINLLVQNANRHSPGWTVGVVDDTAYQNLVFDKQNCLQVLHQLAQTFETEFWIDNKTLHLTKREISSGYTFEYGKGNGLYEITRQNKSNANILTRLAIRGGSTNLPTGYGSDALLMPNGAQFIEDQTKIDLYGLIEKSETFGEIFPKREGVVTGVVAGDDNWKYLYDTALDFDINAQASPVGDAKISFITGLLASYTFTINSYNHVTKEIIINKNTEETNLDIPGNLLRPAVGDKYVLIDIIMPQSYVDAAQLLLKNTAQIHYDKNSDPDFLLAYSANCDRLFIKQNNIEVVLGTTAILYDGQIGINTELRIAKYSRDLQDANLYTQLVWSDTIGANEIIRQYQQQKRTLQLLESSGLLDINQLRKNIFLNRLSESDGYLYLAGNKVKAGLADLATNALHANLADYALDADKWDGRQFDDYLNQPLRTTDDVRVKSLISTAFVSGALGSGFKIDENGNATFDNLTVRKQFNVFELVLNKISGTNGALAVTDTIKILTVTETSTGYDCTIETDNNTIAVPFQVDDLIRCQVFNGTSIKYYFAKITAVGNGTFTIAKAGKVGAGIPAAGDTVVRFGNTTNVNRQGLLYLTASDSGAPYLDVLDGITSDNLTGKTKVRLGKLTGITDADLGVLAGYGIYTDNAYIKGVIHVTGGNAQTIGGSLAVANAAASAAQTNAINTATSQAAADATAKASAAQVAAINIAASDATAKANTSQGNAATDAQSKAAAAQTAAQNYATAQSAYEREIAKAYADGIVSNEEAARIAEVAVKLQLAKDDATAKVTAAQAAANGYTDSKALATLSTAQSYADASAISKANVAQANAVSLASTDAQIKASAAQAAAALLSQQLVDGVKIGGRNLILNSKYDSGANESYRGFYFSDLKNLQDKWVSLSFDVDFLNLKGSRAGMGLALRFIDGSIQYIVLWIDTSTPVTLKKRVSIIVKIDNKEIEGYAQGVASIQNVVSGTGYIINPKFEIGNKATDWTPAPEDVQAAIDTANALAQTAQNNYTALTASLKSLAYQDVVELSKLGSTVIQGGKIKTTLLDADFIRANVVNAAYINTLEIITNTLKTSPSGKRVEINGVDNNITLRDVNGITIVEIDDDTAFESQKTYYNPYEVIKYYGPGIKVGIDGERKAGMGRYGFTTINVDGKLRHSLGLKRGFDLPSEINFDTGHGFYLRRLTDKRGSSYPEEKGFIKYKIDVNGDKVLIIDDNNPWNLGDDEGIYWNDAQTAYATYGPCSGYNPNTNSENIGSEHNYTTPAHTYSSSISKADANTQASNFAQTQAQNEADNNGYCYWT